MLYETVTLTLLKVRGVGAKSVAAFWNSGHKPESPSDLYELLDKGCIPRLSTPPNYDQLEKLWKDATALIERCANESVVVMGRAVPIPMQLRNIPDPPLLLFAIGDHRILTDKAIAIIGTRQPTDYGREAARRMARTLGSNGWVITSGLAEGCDTEGHEGCLDAGAPTVAILAHGFGSIYPARNKDLATRIIDGGGCLVSEYPPGQPPTKSSFIERDRLQSGLSRGIVVIETDVKGGTMHTVRHAEAQSRAIATLAHPGHLQSEPKTQGNQALIRDNRAVPIANKDDLLSFASSLEAYLEDQLPEPTKTQLDLGI